jgi:hypothetical protein
MTDPVVPIRPDVQLRQARSLQLLEFVAQSLVALEADDSPVAIAFMLYAKDGSTRTGWMNEDADIGADSLRALAGAKFLYLAGQAEG